MSAAAALVEYLVRHFAKRRAIVVEAPTVYGHSLSQEFVRAFQRTGGRILARLQAGESVFRIAPLR